MSKINHQWFNINKEGDAIVISLHLYNLGRDDLLHNQTRITGTVFELLFYNTFHAPIEIHNPELVIYPCQVEASLLRYCSSQLATIFPRTIMPRHQFSIGYQPHQIDGLLKQHVNEMIRFQVRGTNGLTYSTLALQGDRLEDIIEKKQNPDPWPSKDLYTFDQRIE